MESPIACEPRLAQCVTADVGTRDALAFWSFSAGKEECVAEEDGRDKAPARPSA